MKLFILVLLSAFLTGCEKARDDLFGFLGGTEISTIVLAPASVQLSENQVQYQLSDPAVALGEHSSICVSLLGGVSLENNTKEQIDRKFASLLGGAQIFAALKSEDGERFEFSNPRQAWAKYGVIESDDELSACIYAKRGEMIPKGTKIQEILVHASQPIDVKGIYWLSMEDVN